MIRFQAFFILTVLWLSAPSYAADERFLDIQEITSPGGISAWLVEDHSVPVIAVSFAFEGAGSTLDPADKQGLVQLASNTMDEGAGQYDSQSFQKILTDNSIALSYSAGRDAYYGSLKTLSRQRDLAFDLLRLSLTEPRFDEEPLQRMKDANMARLRSSLSNPDWMAARLMNDTIYAGHPYAQNSGGTLTSLQNITAGDLKNYRQDYLTRDRLKIAVTGDITAEELAVLLDRSFAALPTSGKENVVADMALTNPGITRLYKRDQPQTIIQIAQPGITRQDPDWHAAQIMNFILGSSGFGSRLMEEIREKRGLTYGIYTGFHQLDHAPSLNITTSTGNDKVQEVLELIRQEWIKMHDTEISQQELEDAKAYLIGSMPLALSSTSQISSLMLSMMLDNLPGTYLDDVGDRIAEIDINDVSRIARRLLNPALFTIILVGDPADITPTDLVEALPNVE